MVIFHKDWDMNGARTTGSVLDFIIMGAHMKEFDPREFRILGIKPHDTPKSVGTTGYRNSHMLDLIGQDVVGQGP